MAPYGPAIGETMYEYDKGGFRLDGDIVFGGMVGDIMQFVAVAQRKEVMCVTGPVFGETPEPIPS